MAYITASKLYDYIQCPHRVWRDIYGPQKEKAQETNPFVELLWEKGVRHEEKVVAGLGDFLNLKDGTLDQRFERTVAAMKNKTLLIYQGVLKDKNTLGIPDILKMLPSEEYIAVDIKAGMGFAGADEEEGEEGKPKKHYAAQLCLYTDLLKRLGFAKHNLGKIIDIHNEEVEYNLAASMGARTPETWWSFYLRILADVEKLMKNQESNKPAWAGICKLCPWHDSCEKWCKKTKDLTTIFYLGRSFRERLNQDLGVETIEQFLKLDIDSALARKEKEKQSGNKDFLLRIGKDNLVKAVNRAKILYQTKKPVAYSEIKFPQVKYELFFDIEDDPTQEFIYLHGVYERNGGKERFIDFTATEVSDIAEKNTWAKFWQYIDSLPKDDFAVYYYSAHEKTTYKKLQKRYPDVISSENVAGFFDNPNVIDLYKIVQKQTDWPVSNYSLKTLATYLGFKWRDETPSGALSIQWFNQYLETNDQTVLKRILEYNEDDCKATMVLKDALEKL